MLELPLAELLGRWQPVQVAGAGFVYLDDVVDDEVARRFVDGFGPLLDELERGFEQPELAFAFHVRKHDQAGVEVDIADEFVESSALFVTQTRSSPTQNSKMSGSGAPSRSRSRAQVES